MPLCHRIGQAFRWHPTFAARRWHSTFPPRELSDLIRVQDEAGTLIRVHDEAGTLMIALAGGHDCSWSIAWPEGSRLLLDLLLDAWRSTRGSIDTRAPAAISELRKHFPARARALAPANPNEFDLGPPGGTVIIASIEGSSCRLDWIGPDLGLLIRDFAVARRTTPHSMQEQLRAQGMREEDLAKLPVGVMQTILQTISEYLEPGFEAGSLASPLTLEDGDWILLVNYDLSRVLTSDDLASCASSHGSPQRVAEELVRLAFEKGDLVYAAAVAVRCEEVDVITEQGPHHERPDR